MARLRLSRLSETMSLALRAGGSVCGSTVDRRRRAKDVAGQVFAPGFLAGDFSSYVLSSANCALSYNTLKPCLS
jgi:hypothetical protein